MTRDACGGSVTPSSHSLLTHLREALHQVSKDGLHVVLAVSGGADSIALLRAWSSLQRERGDQILVATFDHQLREGSDDDARFVADCAERLDLPVVVGKPPEPIQGTGGNSIEGAARQARYRFLIEAARHAGATFVATAHTADDQVETVLFRIFRGTGLRGLAGIPKRRRLAAGVELIRPFRDVWRTEIDDYLAQHSQESRFDPSNADLTFTRNRLRGETLPYLRQEFNPRVDEAVLRLSDLAADAASCEEARIACALEQARLERSANRVLLSGPVLRSLGRDAAPTIRDACRDQGWPLRRLGRRQLLKVVALAHGDQIDAHLLPDGIAARRQRDTGHIELTWTEFTAKKRGRGESPVEAVAEIPRSS